MRKARPFELLFDIFNSILMFVVVLIMAYPFLYVFLYSISDPAHLKAGLMLWPEKKTVNGSPGRPGITLNSQTWQVTDF